MEFIGEIERAVGSINEFAVEIGEKYGYAYGVKRILSFDKNRLAFLVGKKKVIEVLGENLGIQSFVSGDVRFCGTITSAEIKSF